MDNRNPGSPEVQFILAVSDLLRQGRTVDELVQLVYQVADVELVFADEETA